MNYELSMHEPSVKHTLYIFERLYRDMPPLVPEIIRLDMRQALEQMRHNYTLSLKELEATLFIFGKNLWPYRKAFDEFFDIYDGELGEAFLLQRLKPKSKKRYKEFLDYGGSYRDLHTGGPITFFSSGERADLCTFLVDVKKDVRDYTVQSVTSTEKQKYESLIVEYQSILDDIEKRLDALRVMADNEQEHPELAAEIRAQIEGFEHGLCLLGPHTQFAAVCSSEEHFVGRKREKLARV